MEKVLGLFLAAASVAVIISTSGILDSPEPEKWPLPEMVAFEKRVLRSLPMAHSGGHQTCICTMASSQEFVDLYAASWLKNVQSQWGGPGEGPVYVIAAKGVTTPPGMERIEFDIEDQLGWASDHYKHQHQKLHVWGLPCSRALYMDLDTRAVGPLRKIFQACTAPFCAIPDFGQGRHPWGFPIFNGGVMLVTPDLSVKVAAERYFEMAPQTRFVEQTWLNQALGLRAVQLLSPIYNAQQGCQMLPARVLSQVIICHCTQGKEKQDCMSSLQGY